MAETRFHSGPRPRICILHHDDRMWGYELLSINSILLDKEHETIYVTQIVVKSQLTDSLGVVLSEIPA